MQVPAIHRRVARAEQLREGRPVRIGLHCAECGGPRHAAVLVRRSEGAVRAWMESGGAHDARALEAFVTADGHVVVSLPADVVSPVAHSVDCVAA